MPMIPPSQPLPPPTDAAVRADAQARFLSLRDAPSRGTRAQIEAWRRADPRHEAAYRAVEADWQKIEAPARRLAAREADEIAVYLTAMDGAKRRKRRVAGLGLVLMLALAGGLWLERPHLLRDMTADHVAARGERQSLTLTDGTAVLLDADSAIAVEFSDHERRVRLLRGAAFFDVTPASVPFIVAAAGGEVRVMGTGFDVRLLDDRAVVTLEHGSVAVSAGPAAPPVVLEPGQKADFGQTGVGAVEGTDLQDALAWRAGRFVFYRARLGDVLGEIERYRAGRIVIVPPALAEERVTGSFMLSDPEAALTSLQASVGFRLTNAAGRLTVVGP